MRQRRSGAILIALMLFGCTTTDTPNPSVPFDFGAIPKYERGGPITAPKVISRVEPQTSREFRTKYKFASAKIEAVVNEEGRVIAAHYLSGDREWAQLLAQAVARWRFEPATLEGKPVTVRFEISSTFRSSS